MSEIPEGIDPEHFKKMTKDYKERAKEKIAQLKKDLQTFAKDPNETTLAAVRMPIHKFAGNAASFGFDKVTTICKKWDQKLTKMLENPNSITKEIVKEIEGVVQEIEKELFHGG